VVDHSVEALKLAADLDRELAAYGESRGVQLSWSVPERATISLIQDQVDRKVELTAAYDSAEDKQRLRLAAEIRLIEGSIGRLLKLVNTQPRLPSLGPVSHASARGRRAADIRWGNV
jgi:hypothetical protein